jgi:hypothetical protein
MDITIYSKLQTHMHNMALGTQPPSVDAQDVLLRWFCCLKASSNTSIPSRHVYTVGNPFYHISLDFPGMSITAVVLVHA